MTHSKYIIIGMVAVAFLSWSGPTVFAQESSAAVAGEEGQGKKGEFVSELDRYKIRKPTYTYLSSGNRDPFFPLTVKTEDPPEAGRPKTPLETFDIKQMKLLGILSDSKGPHALIGLPDGKFYNVLPGMSIGLRRGTVKEILPDRVVVMEHVKDYKGNEKIEEVFLRLREEGDK